MNGSPDPALRALRAAVRATFGFVADRPDVPANMVQRAIAALDEASFDAGAGRGSADIRACGMLDDILDAAPDGPLGDTIRALALARSPLRWMQNTNYKDQPELAAYLSNSGFCEFVGPRGIAESDTVAIGFLLMGPKLDYPNHRHPAEELYVILSGEAEWRRDGEDWTARAPGSCVFHASHQGHAMRTGATPLLALYCWSGDLDSLPNPVISSTPGDPTPSGDRR